MSFTLTVPAAVPSLFQSSEPLVPSLAWKKSVPFTAVRYEGLDPPEPGDLAFRLLVAAGRTVCRRPGYLARVERMAVPGRSNEAPADLAATELFAVDAYATEFDARVTEVDEAGARIRLDRTAFYPGGGGQPYDLGTFETSAGNLAVTLVRREAGAIWHTVEGDLPASTGGTLAWRSRHPSSAATGKGRGARCRWVVPRSAGDDVVGDE